MADDVPRGSADSEEKREPVSDIDTAVVDSLKVLDPKRPIREADIGPHFMLQCSRAIKLGGGAKSRWSLWRDAMHFTQGHFRGVSVECLDRPTISRPWIMVSQSLTIDFAMAGNSRIVVSFVKSNLLPSNMDDV